MSKRMEVLSMLVLSIIIILVVNGIFLSIYLVPIELLILLGIPYAVWRLLAEPKPKSIDSFRFFREMYNVLWKQSSVRRLT